ncbi:MAG: hypothetical protein JRM80_12290 [Nitrososphaerota archaeon]|nr:hypothetical protein [Nitrososphaerota archaeon]
MTDGDPRPKAQLLVPLLFLFLVFVIFDVGSTVWLINNSPGGLENEVNPAGVALYSSFGAAGLIFPKFALFILFAGMTVYFAQRYSQVRWFVEASQTLVLAQIALSLVISFNNFIAILGVYFVNGIWPIVNIPPNMAVLAIYASDLGLGAIFANGVMYIWGIRRVQTHLKVIVSLMVLITPVLLFAAGFRTDIWLFGIYVASASTAIGLFFYGTEEKGIRTVTPVK